MFTSPNMSIKVWDQPGDVFAYTELANNFSLIDAHDHSTGKGVPIPTNGLANLAVTSGKIADGAVTATKIPDGSITDSKLANSSLTAYRVLESASAVQSAGSASDFIHLQGGSFVASGSAVPQAAVLLSIRASDLAIAGKTTMLRLRVMWATNSIAPAQSFTAGIWPVASVGGSSANLVINTGARLGDATVTTPSASSQGTAIGADFGLPTDGNYVFGARFTGALAAGAYWQVTTIVQYRYV